MKKKLWVIGLIFCFVCLSCGGNEEKCSPACQPGLVCYCYDEDGDGGCRHECHYPCDWSWQCPVERPYCQLIGDGKVEGYDGVCVSKGSSISGGVCEPGKKISCYTGMPGICALGERHCLDDGSDFGPCEPLSSGASEICGDRIDNNCDGRPDENCLCQVGEKVSCLTGLSGVCSAGMAECLADGSGFGFCVPQVQP